jgi:hypothetical protein
MENCKCTAEFKQQADIAAHCFRHLKTLSQVGYSSKTMTTSWDGKHGAESLIDYDQYGAPLLTQRSVLRRDHKDPYGLHASRGSTHDYEDSYAVNYERDGYPAESHSGEALDVYQFPDETNQYPSIHKPTPSDDFSSRGSLVKNAGEISGVGLYPDNDSNNHPYVEQFGIPLRSATSKGLDV